MNFSALLEQQKSASSQMNQLIAAAEKESKGGGFEKDERLWKPRVDKSGNGYAVIRFLPAPDSDIPWVKFYDHGFKGDSGHWFIENCPTSLGNTCPLCEQNSKLWNSGIESDKEIARIRKRRLHYVANVLVQKDAAEPENEGRIVIFMFGKKIFDKLMEAMQPAFDDDTPINPFNLFSGASFKLKIRQVGGFWNYDSSEFTEPSALYDGDEDKLKAMFDKLHTITEFVDPAKFKSYDELETKLNRVLGVAEEVNNAITSSAQAGAVEYTPGNTIREEFSNTPTNNTKTADVESEEDEDDMEYFKNIANKYA